MNSPRTNRVLQILALVASNSKPTQLREITAALEVHPSMVSRMVADLVEAGLLTKIAYRSVIATPALALLGQNAAKNHPVSRIVHPLLRKKVEELGFSCEFSALTSLGLYHFFHVQRGTPGTSAPLWRSDAAAVCMAAEKKSWEECQEFLTAAETPEQGVAYFKERFNEASLNWILKNYHAGRFWQITVPVICNDLVFALSFSGLSTADMDKGEFEISKAAAQIKSAYKDIADSNA